MRTRQHFCFSFSASAFLYLASTHAVMVNVINLRFDETMALRVRASLLLTPTPIQTP